MPPASETTGPTPWVSRMAAAERLRTPWWQYATIRRSGCACAAATSSHRSSSSGNGSRKLSASLTSSFSQGCRTSSNKGGAATVEPSPAPARRRVSSATLICPGSGAENATADARPVQRSTGGDRGLQMVTWLTRNPQSVFTGEQTSVTSGRDDDLLRTRVRSLDAAPVAANREVDATGIGLVLGHDGRAVGRHAGHHAGVRHAGRCPGGRAAGRLLAAGDSDSLEGGDKASGEAGEGAAKSDEVKLTVTRGDGQKKKPADSGDSLAFLKDWPFWAIVGGVVLAGAATFMIVENHNQKHACGAVYDGCCFGAK